MANFQPDAQAHDDTPTLFACGIIAYCTEAMVHEAAGHGGVCLAEHANVTVLAPLWMRCSISTLEMVAAGPAANFVAAAVFYTALRLVKPAHAAASMLLWLGFTFNALVACGYLAVGALTGFGDWPAIFASVQPPMAWRIPALCVAAAGYYGCLRLAAMLFRRWSGDGRMAQARLWQRAMLPAIGAAIVACAAELAGGRGQIMPIVLALGCTLAVGFSLTSINGVLARAAHGTSDCGPILRSNWLIIAGVAIGTLFISVIGPGLTLTRP